MSDIATGLSTCVLKDGTQTITANIPLSSHKFTGLSAGTGAGDSVRYEQVGTLAGNNTWAGTQAFQGVATFTAAPIISITASGTALTLTSTDAGVASAPNIDLFRNSISPTANDDLSGLFWKGRNSTPATYSYAYIYASILDPTAATEDATFRFYASIAGAATSVMNLGPGLQIGSPTGGDKGLGTNNAAVAHYAAGRPLEPIGNAIAGNFILAASVGSSALTITLQTLSGGTPSATDPVSIAFRNAAAATGDSTDITLTNPQSLVISSGSTMGFASATAGRLWIVGFNDGGTFRIGAVNVLSGTSISALSEGILVSATSEGGAGGADSAQVIYANAAVTTKAIRILGYFEWGSGLTTAGTWDAVPTKIQLFGPGNRKPGDVVQSVRTDTGAVATGTTVIPQDDTIPQISEGDEYMTRAITPSAKSNMLRISVQAQFANSLATNGIGVALFQDATAGALKALPITAAVTAAMIEARLDHKMLAATASSTTFRTRAGGGSASTTTFNGQTGGRLYGGVMNSYMEVTEIMA